MAKYDRSDSLDKRGPPIDLDPATLDEIRRRKKHAGDAVKLDPEIDNIAAERGISKKTAAGIVAMFAYSGLPDSSIFMSNKSPRFRAAVIRARG